MLLIVVALVLALVPPEGQHRPPRDPVARPNSASPNTSISGRVTDAETGRPLADATVTAMSTDAAITGRMRSYSGVSDQLGGYTISALPPGDYLVRAAPDEYRATHRDAAPGGLSGLALFNAPPITIAAGEQRTGVDIALPRAYAIEGVVLNEAGRAMVHLDVRAERLDGPTGPARSALSDDRGMFRIFGLAPGVYRLCAAPRGQAPPLDVAGGDGRRYVETCVPSGADPGAPGAIRIQASDVGGAVVHLSRTGTFTVSGQVVDASGALVQDARIALWRQDGPGRNVGIGVEATGGGFIARNLIPGQYMVRADRAVTSDRPAQLGMAPVRVDASDVAGITVVLAPGADVRGVVQLEGGTLTPEARARIRIRARPPANSLGPRDTMSTAGLAGNSSFALHALFGSTVIEVQNLPDGWAVQSISYGARDITHREATFTTSAEPDALRIVLSNRTARLSVRTFDRNGAPALGLVAVMPAEPERRREALRGMGRLTAFGVHDFGWFAPGEYLVISSSNDGPLAVGPNRIDLAELAKTAVRVTLAAGENRIVDLRLPPGGRP